MPSTVAKDDSATSDGAVPPGLGNMFSDPNLLGKLALNPRTKNYLADPAFVQKIRLYAQNPNLATTAFDDPRMIDVMGVAMGIDMQGFSRPEGSDELPPGVVRQDEPAPQSTPPPQRSAPSASSSKPAPPPASEPEDVEMSEEDLEEARIKKEAEDTKKAGSEAYKKRNFEEAAALFQKAWDTWPKDVTYLTNLGAVYFEQGEYDKTIETCEKAVEEGRSVGTSIAFPIPQVDHSLRSVLTTNLLRRPTAVLAQLS
ncbi:hypothetical protein BDZ94DRAFT_546092 [Collybia nuda]|uniref:STI1/HOP DP domain-containing protein n=1 Tax=Collybia nuda TaxID=64659 RepID=A0A9P6CQP5_9AGAR|nr:hypothetical protein BDZ94DRAFT_546092 [Collybia nuda]